MSIPDLRPIILVLALLVLHTGSVERAPAHSALDRYLLPSSSHHTTGGAVGRMDPVAWDTREETSWRSIAGDVDEAIIQHESIALVRELTWQQILQHVALSLKANRPDHIVYWENQMRLRYPSAGYQWLYDLQNPNPFAQIALAEAYAGLGLMDDAIQIGEQALARYHWHWGHYVVAKFYRRLGRSTEVERHMRAAVEYGGTEEIVARYRVELADLYIERHETALAHEQYCQIVRGVSPGRSYDRWRDTAVARLAQLIGLADSEVFNWCASH